MKYTVRLKYFEDDVTGEWGFTHINTCNNNNPFNAFYSPEGIFPDVFEHYFEGNSYFTGANENNVIGEMVATAHKWYIVNEIGVNSFMYRRGSPFPNFQVDTIEIIKDAYYNYQSWIGSGYEGEPENVLYQYPYHDIGIPKQSPTGTNIETEIDEYEAQLFEFYTQCNLHDQIKNLRKEMS